MRVKKLPMILALHLKRFKYMEQYNRHIKVSHRVVFPLELRLFNTVGSNLGNRNIFFVVQTKKCPSRIPLEILSMYSLKGSKAMCITLYLSQFYKTLPCAPLA